MVKEQVSDPLQAFAARLNELLDDAGLPKNNSGRQVQLIKSLSFKMSQPGVRKWLVGESMPETSTIGQLVADINALMPGLAPVREEWLLFGRLPKREDEMNVVHDPAEKALLEYYRHADETARKAMLQNSQLLSNKNARTESVTGNYDKDIETRATPEEVRGASQLSHETEINADHESEAAKNTAKGRSAA